MAVLSVHVRTDDSQLQNKSTYGNLNLKMYEEQL